MSPLFRFFGLLLLATLCIAPVASAHEHGAFFGGGFVGFGPGWGWYGPGWGWYGPYWGGWGYPYPYPYAYEPINYPGKVKLVDVPKDTLVYVDGGYAGRAAKLKKFPLKPGDHSIELRDHTGHTFHQERIHVIPGKTVEIRGSTAGH